MTAADGKQYNTDVVDAEQLLRLIQSIRSLGNYSKVKSKTVLIDESGDFGCQSRDLVMAATVTEKIEVLRGIERKHQKNTGKRKTPGELKYVSSSPKKRMDVLSDVERIEPSIYVVVARKKDLPDGFGPDGIKLYFDVIRVLLSSVMDGETGPFEIIFDDHSAFHPKKRDGSIANLEETVTMEVAEGKNRSHEIIRVITANSEKEKALQSHDFVVGSSKDWLIFGSRSPFKIIKKRSRLKEIRK